MGRQVTQRLLLIYIASEKDSGLTGRRNWIDFLIETGLECGGKVVIQEKKEGRNSVLERDSKE